MTIGFIFIVLFIIDYNKQSDDINKIDKHIVMLQGIWCVYDESGYSNMV